MKKMPNNEMLAMKNKEEQATHFKKAQQGDLNALGLLLMSYRERLERIVSFRMDARLQSRIDAGDVVQEAFLDATRRFEYYLDNKKTSFFLWLRYLTIQKLAELHRHHFGAEMRSKDREVSIFQKLDRDVTTAQIASFLLDEKTSVSQALVRDEAKVVLEQALGEMDPIDQEVLALRHFEQLSNVEVAESLGLNSSAASKRFVRALQRLKSIVEQYS